MNFSKARKKIFTTLSLLMLLVFSTTLVCSAATLIISTVRQERSNWCWAACSEMVGKWKYGNRSQTQIVTHIKGSAVNEPASSSETARAATYASNNNASFTSGGRLSLNTVTSMINNRNNPLIAGCSGSGVGHMLVVHGVSGNDFFICDPATGRSSWVNYSVFSNSYGGRAWRESVYIR